MNPKPFLTLFKTELPAIDPAEASEPVYDRERQVSLEDSSPCWRARTRRRPTSCRTAGHRLKAGYTRSGKWKPSRYVKGKQDRRAGR